MENDDDEFPHNLTDLQKGDAVEGDSGVDATKPPSTSFSLSLISLDITRVENRHVRRFYTDWLDAKKYSRGQTIFKRHPLNFVLTWHFSLVMGFCVKPLLEALVFTGNSSTPQSSLKRYIKTYLYLAEWHLCGDMFDSTVLASDMYYLEEGGFFVISVKNGELILEHRFYYFKDFIVSFYPREY